MLEFLQRTLDGWLEGSAYALVGLGLTLTFGTLRRLNLAYGATAMLAAYVGAWLFARHAFPAWGVALVVVGLAALIGLYVERLCFGAIGSTPANHEGRGSAQRVGGGFDGAEVVALASSFALWMQLEQLAVNLLPRHLNPFPNLAAQTEWSVAGLYLRPDRLAIAALAVVITLALGQWLLRTWGGLAWRAAATQRTAAGLVGIRVGQVQATAFLVACALSGVAAFAVLSLEGQVTPMLGMWMLTKGLVAAMLGGLGSVRGVLIGGWLLGIVEAHAQAAFGAVGREFATYALLFLVLVVGPAGRASLTGGGGWRHAA
ncbi:branched-chain amino acid ABC transporter permease [Hydrogenophaga sp. R2]|uniref:branched-chain amino acid ABC transporter permease n=1 Tax=Hydrogenophaga sp. R2 TaxID=3132827 RepID=UPI003CF22020